MRILVDMDEVLADFVGGALRIHGWTRSRLEQVWSPGTWSIVELMGLTKEEFWAPIEQAGEGFWRCLGELPWMVDLVAWVCSQTNDWYIVTSPSHCLGAYVGKFYWLADRLGKQEAHKRFIPTPDKHLLAKEDVYLIDDREETVRKFSRAGGIGVVFPSRHNRLYSKAQDSVGYLKQLFKERSYGVQVQERERCIQRARQGNPLRKYPRAEVSQPRR